MQINNRQTPAGQTHGTRCQHAFSIRPAMHQGCAHGLEQRRVRGSATVQVDKTGQTTHVFSVDRI
jgi:hypothetical protein